MIWKHGVRKLTHEDMAKSPDLMKSLQPNSGAPVKDFFPASLCYDPSVRDEENKASEQAKTRIPYYLKKDE